MQNNNSTTLRGIVVAADWDDHGKVIGLALVTYDEDRVMIEPNTRGSALLSCIRKAVTVDGILKQVGPVRQVDVLTFAIDEPPWDDCE